MAHEALAPLEAARAERWASLLAAETTSGAHSAAWRAAARDARQVITDLGEALDMAISFIGSQAAKGGDPGATSLGPRATSGLGAKGAWAEVISSTPFDASWVMVEIHRTETSGGLFLVDIGIGASGSETVLIPDIVYNNGATAVPTVNRFLLPLFVPAGSRLSMRSQASGGAVILTGNVTVFAAGLGGVRGLGRVEVTSVNTSTRRGVTVDPGAVAHTKGSWVELIASTAFDYQWGVVSIMHPEAMAATIWSFTDIGIGPAGSEVVLIPDLMATMGTTPDRQTAVGVSLPVSVPAGSRLAARVQSSHTTATERTMDVVFHGVG